MADKRNDLGYHWRRSTGVYDAFAQPKAEAPPQELVEDEMPEDEPAMEDELVEVEKPDPTPPTDPNTLWAPKPTKPAQKNK